MAQQKAAAKRKKTGGRPAATLTERNQVRHAAGEWEAWTAYAMSLVFGGASPWLRSLANREIAAAAQAANANVPKSKSAG